MGRYSFIKDGAYFSLFEDGLLLATFKRDQFREVLNGLGRGSNWIGSMLRLYLKQFPHQLPPHSRTDLERVVDRYKDEGLAEYLRSKGYRVTKKIGGVSDEDIIAYLETQGYIIQGLLNGYYYDSEELLEKKKIQGSLNSISGLNSGRPIA